MARSKDNVLTQGLSGSIAGLMTFRQRAGKTVVTKMRRRTPASKSPQAVAVRERFRAALNYALIAIKDPETKAFYQSKASAGQSAFNMAFKDAVTPPVIHSINTVNYHGAGADTITVQAIDPFKVVSVKVSIKEADGTLLEEGNAVQQSNTVDWLYTATKANAGLTGSKVTAVATGFPGNSSSLEVTL
jgi:hypothetical protein